MLSNLLALSEGRTVALLICLPIVALCIGAAAALFVYKKIVNKRLGDAKLEADKIIEDARLEAKGLRKEALLEAKEEQLRLRNEFEKESKQRRSEIQKTENRLIQKEELLDKKEAVLDVKIEDIDKKRAQMEERQKLLDKQEAELETERGKIIAEIERVAAMTREEAKQLLISRITEEAQLEAVALVKEIEAKAKEEGEKKAKDIVGLAIQRCAVDHAAETTISVVELPSEEMKGKIIGRVGRNIKAFESVTGVD
ncbi:MAG: DUF3552 domain-containing protein, partial [Clostridia bacterium]|nr:DUF3552 domain-containing protein [Clostridia bacterium]